MKKISYLITASCLLVTACEDAYVNVDSPHSRRPAYYHQPTYQDEPEQPQTTHVETAEEKRNRLALQLGIALGVKIGTRPEPDDNVLDSAVKIFLSRGADSAIESTVDEAFADQPPQVRRQISIVIEALFEGDLTLSTVGERNRKQEMIEWLQRHHPGAAQSAEVIDFLYEVYQRGHSR
jgi:hypothetical protein